MRKDKKPAWFTELAEVFGEVVYEIPEEEVLKLVLLDWQKRILTDKIVAYPEKSDELQRRLGRVVSKMIAWAVTQEARKAQGGRRDVAC